MRIGFALLILGAGAVLRPAQAPRATLLLLSIDGLRPDYVTQADAHKLKIPYLRRLISSGTHATSVRGVLPTVTYSSHTTILTGVRPAAHGIYSNKPFDPSFRNPDAWYWYSEDIRVPTLWDAAAKAGRVVGSVSWPVSVGSASIRFNIPEYAGARNADDLKMVRSLAGPSLMLELEKAAGLYITDVNQAIARDWARTRYAAEIISHKHVEFLTVHLAALDHLQHEHGPFSAEALAALGEIDGMVAKLSEVADSICIVSDHGFARVDRVLKLDAALVKAGLITLKGQGDSLQSAGVADWKAMSWPAGGSAAILLKTPADAVKTRQVLDTLASDPANGIAGILDKAAIAKLGGAPPADFWVDMRPGFAVSASLSGAVSAPAVVRGFHGYSPSHAEMGSFFLIAGPGVQKGRDLGVVDMRSIAPTLAKSLRVPFPSAELPSLDVYVDGR